MSFISRYTTCTHISAKRGQLSYRLFRLACDQRVTDVCKGQLSHMVVSQKVGSRYPGI